MGLLRLLIALGVVTEHAGRSYFTGSYTAVQIFFIISGFYMALIFSSGKYASATKFFASRIARLFPVYWAAVMVSVVVALIANCFFLTTSTVSSLAGRLSELQQTNPLVFAWTIFANGFLVFADYAWFMNGVNVVKHPTQLLVQPPVWTLALELYFYALCPFLTRARTRFIILLMGGR